MAAVPRIADVKCQRLQFQPGDRILVRVYERLDKESAKRLRATVEKWAGNCVEVLIVDMTLMDVTIEKADGTIIKG